MAGRQLAAAAAAAAVPATSPPATLVRDPSSCHRPWLRVEGRAFQRFERSLDCCFCATSAAAAKEPAAAKVA
eukprot:363288-Chlamydomonas_euryale.AAC.8